MTTATHRTFNVQCNLTLARKLTVRAKTDKAAEAAANDYVHSKNPPVSGPWAIVGGNYTVQRRVASELCDVLATVIVTRDLEVKAPDPKNAEAAAKAYTTVRVRPFDQDRWQLTRSHFAAALPVLAHDVNDEDLEDEDLEDDEDMDEEDMDEDEEDGEDW